jgi:periplasmic divalent cation tolerance protein
MTDQIAVLVTAPSADEASRIAKVLVSDRLAACVNIVPGVHSIYEWEGKLCTDTEALLIIKTAQDAYSLLEARLKEIHPYSVPEVIALKIDRGSAQYLEWISQSVGPIGT